MPTAELLHISAPDDPDGVTYVLAPVTITAAIQRRFERRPVVLHPSEPDTYIYDPGNFWDGPTHIEFDAATGTFSFEGWTGRQVFPAIGPQA